MPDLPTAHTFAASPWPDLIRRRCGLSVRDSQIPALVELLRARMKAREVHGPSRYYELLEAERDGGPEWTMLVERLVSHDTTFFRYQPSFEVLRTRVLPELRRRPDVGGNPITMLSAGCSTGQEAYSLAMVAMANQDTCGEFTVCGIDISRGAIETARRGRYGARETAAIPPVYRHRFLRHVRGAAAHQSEFVDDVRDRVRFSTMNLNTVCRMLLSYDVIFCQNLFIYLAPAAIAHLVALLGASLGPGGYLVPGPGEVPLGAAPGLEPVSVDGVRVLRRVGGAASAVATEVRP